MLVHHDESEQYLGVGESERLTDAGSMMVLMMREHVLQRIKQSHNILLRTGRNRPTCLTFFERVVHSGAHRE